MPLVYNEIAPAVDWLIGTERKNKGRLESSAENGGRRIRSGCQNQVPEVHFGRQPSSVRSVSGICGCNQDRGWLGR